MQELVKDPTVSDLFVKSSGIRNLSKQSIKLRMFNAAIIPTLLYGSKAWTSLSQHIKRLQSFCMRYL